MRQVRKLLESQHSRHKNQQTVVEGGRLIEDALGAGIRPLTVLYSPKWVAHPGGRALLSRLQLVSSRMLYVTDRLLEQISGVETSQGILAVVPAVMAPVTELPDPSSGPALFFIAAGLQDPGNLGALIRTGLAAGVHALGVTRATVDAFNPKTVRASMGGVFKLPMVALDEDWTKNLRQRQVRLYATAVEGGVPYDEVDWTLPSALVLGNEGHGLDPSRYGDLEQVTIPMSPAAESLNVAAAGAVLLFHAALMRRRQGISFLPPAML